MGREKSCVIFGGAGFVGKHLAKHFLESGRFQQVHLADIRPNPYEGQPGISASFTDVRHEIPRNLVEEPPEWIFNLAAIHREPGHRREEYFETNLAGARNVCNYAEAVCCNNIYFTSSISVYGPTTGPTSESSPIQPSTPYGGSKYPAELIHEGWYRSGQNRRLIISRPGVLYGPGDPGNILRMIRAVARGYFAFPGSRKIYKSYGYIGGFIKSIDFVIDRGLDYFCYNYVERQTLPLGKLVETIREYFGYKAVAFPIPLLVLLPISIIIQALMGSRSPIHPVRVKKAATPTNIVPKALMDHGFDFYEGFEKTLEEWIASAPEDFGISTPEAVISPARRMKWKKGPERIETLSRIPAKPQNQDRLPEKEEVRS